MMLPCALRAPCPWPWRSGWSNTIRQLLLLLDREEMNNWMAAGEKCEVISISDNCLEKNDLMSMSAGRCFPFFKTRSNNFYQGGLHVSFISM